MKVMFEKQEFSALLSSYIGLLITIVYLKYRYYNAFFKFSEYPTRAVSGMYL